MTGVSAIVVLGCATGGGHVATGRAATDGGLRGAALRRVAGAAALWHACPVPRILACGGRRWGGVAESTAMAQELVRAGVPRDVVETELLSFSTNENARFAAERLLPDARRIALVTCDWHLPRATRLFARAGFDVVPVPVAGPERGWTGDLVLRVREALSTALEVLVAS